MIEITTITLGLLVGLALGSLGGGGSTLAVPILVFIAGLSTQDATTASLVAVGVAAAVGVVGHYRRGNVRLGTGVAFGLAGIVGSAVGTAINRTLDGDVLLLLFSALIVFVALRMYRSASGQSANGGSATAAGIRSMGRSELARLALAASGVGLLTGLFGVGGGFAVVPALVLFMGFGTKEAIGTSLVVIAINATMALGLRAGDLSLDWALVLPFLGTLTIGVLIGSAVANRIDSERLTRAFAIMLFAVAMYTAASTAFGW